MPQPDPQTKTDLTKLGKPPSQGKVSLVRTVYVIVTAILLRQERSRQQRSPAQKAFDIVANATLKSIPKSGDGRWAWLMQQDEQKIQAILTACTADIPMREPRRAILRLGQGPASS